MRDIENHVPIPAQVKIVLKDKNERVIRSLAKTITWNLIDVTVTIAIAYAFTRKIAIALAIGISQQVWESVLYFAHERAWAKVKNI